MLLYFWDFPGLCCQTTKINKRGGSGPGMQTQVSWSTAWEHGPRTLGCSDPWVDRLWVGALLQVQRNGSSQRKSACGWAPSWWGCSPRTWGSQRISTLLETRNGGEADFEPPIWEVSRREGTCSGRRSLASPRNDGASFSLLPTRLPLLGQLQRTSSWNLLLLGDNGRLSVPRASG